jgi:uncharacterized iron-regulated protein
MFKGSLTVILISLMTTLANFSQVNQDSFQVFNSRGKPSSLNEIVNTVERTDVVFLGENHDDKIAHSLQFEILKSVFEKFGKQRKVVLSLEMFERDVQIIIDEYLQNLITEKKFLDDTRPWNNYKTDYRPLLEFAKQNMLSVIAANAPRRYVNMVSRNGRDSLNQLSPAAKKCLAPLPFGEASKEYREKFNRLMGGNAGNNHGLSKILDSQTLWDATMAFSIAEHLKKQKNALVVHLNGSFHTENRLGTAEQLIKYQPNAKVLVITMRYEDDFKNFDKSKHENLGDFVILTDAKEPRSYK